MTKIKYNTMNHRILLFARMKGAPISMKDLKSFSPKVFNDAGRMAKAFLHLSQNGYMFPQEGNTWVITPAGVNHLYSIAKPYRGE